jgi:hypothetical protein
MLELERAVRQARGRLSVLTGVEDINGLDLVEISQRAVT